MNFPKKHYAIIIVVSLAACFLTGCATRAPYFRLDESLAKDMSVFGGTQYVPLVRLCGAYGLECKWDSFIKTAVLERESNRIVLRADSDKILVNGIEKTLDRPVILSGGAVFVPISFVRENFGIIAPAGGVRRTPAGEAAKKVTIRTIVIDPGHGGKDVGAIGRRIRLKEKEMALGVAKRLEGILEGAGIRVIMTRDDDSFVPLSKRAGVANRSGADIFLSVHINASRARSMRGFECYYLSDATDDFARALEAFENSSLTLDEGAAKERSRQLDKALWDMTLTENRRESAELAGYICDSVERSFTISNRGIRAARFYVLKYVHIPAVLVEAGYISNRYEEMKLKDPQFLDRIANAVAGGILKYKKEYERTEGFTRG